LGDAVGGTLLLGFPFVILFLFFGGGAGDAKLMGAIGAWLGWKQGIVVLLCVSVAGVVLAITKAAMNKRLKFVLANVFVSVYTFLVFMLSGRRKQYAENEPARPQNSPQGDELTVPYGVAIFAGVCLAAGCVFLW
jgi:Flp pilus assembly protein protease CpaA